MKKKGLSPLIATVLIIAFVIILFSLVTTWVRRAAIEPGMEQGEAKIASALECAELNLKIVSACLDGTTLKTVIDNTGEIDLSGVKIKAITATGAKTGEFKDFDATEDENQALTTLGRSPELVIDFLA